MNNFEKNIRHYVKLHRELHGIGFSKESIVKDVLNSFEYDEVDTYLEVERIMKYEFTEYGVLMGRFQPFTNGHSEIVQEILRDGKTPIICIGSANKTDLRNPLSARDRQKLIRLVYPFGCKFVILDDKDNWTDWFNNIDNELKTIQPNKDKITLYSHRKAEDKTNFEYCGKHYKEESYVKMFEIEGYNIKNINEVTCSIGQVIHASDVREDEETAKRNVDARIYRVLKDKFGWWK